MATGTDWQSLYVQLGRLLETAPDMSEFSRLRTPEVMQWVGRAQVLVEAAGVEGTSLDFRFAVQKFPYNTWQAGVQEVFTILYRVLGHCEYLSPEKTAGTFIPVGNPFDAFAAVSKLLKPAISDVLIVDPYLDDSILTEFGTAVPDGVTLRLLSDAAFVNTSLEPAARKWASQHGTNRPLAVRLAPPKALHDRAIFLDGKTAWTLTQSFKDFAKRSPAEIVRVDDIAALKIPAYEAIWASASVIV